MEKKINITAALKKINESMKKAHPEYSNKRVYMATSAIARKKGIIK